MEGQQTKNITVLIAGRPYPLKVKNEDEAAIRKIVKEVNEKINHFQLNYTSKDKQDCLSMTLLTYAVDLYKTKQQPLHDKQLTAKVDNINQLLDHLLDQ
ncbi:MAG: cell division protein ZapA [Bacteroidota bacterium]